MKENIENFEILLKQSAMHQLTDEEMQMPDIEEEMRRIEDCTHTSDKIIPMSKPRSYTRTVAAAVAGMIVLSGVAFAAIKFVPKLIGGSTPEATIVTDSVVQQKEVEEVVMPEEIVFDNSYLAEMLDTIASFYGMKPVFANDNLKIIRIHYNFNPEKSIDKVIRDLNHFNKMSITREDSVIYVNPKGQ